LHGRRPAGERERERERERDAGKEKDLLEKIKRFELV
jgi:hypothetical protein